MIIKFCSFISFLLLASQNGRIEIVKALLNKNANIEAINKDGFTALMLGIFLNDYFSNFLFKGKLG